MNMKWNLSDLVKKIPYCHRSETKDSAVIFAKDLFDKRILVEDISAPITKEETMLSRLIDGTVNEKNKRIDSFLYNRMGENDDFVIDHTAVDCQNAKNAISVSEGKDTYIAKFSESEYRERPIGGNTVHITVNGADLTNAEVMADMLAGKMLGTIEMMKERRKAAGG